MKIGLQDVDWGYVGAMLSRESDESQVKFFKAFVKEALSWGSNYQVEQQLAFVNLKLTEKEKEVLGMLSYSENG
jgi:hypothetical protein